MKTTTPKQTQILAAAAVLTTLLVGVPAAAESRRTMIVIYKGGTVAARGAGRALAPAAALRAAAAPRPAPMAVAPRAENVKDLWLVNGHAMDLTAADAAAVAADPRVAEVVENFTVRTPEVEAQALAQTTASENWGLAKIGAQSSWNLFRVSGRGVRIGHLDTGIDASHPDLQGKVAAWAEFNAWGDQVTSVPHDSGIHGTHTAGTLVGGAAGGNAIGVAPGAKLISALVLNGSGGTLLQVLAGMQWVIDPDGNPATDDGAHVLSMSLGAAGQYDVFRTVTDRLVAAGVLPVFAVGNSGAGNADAPGNVPEAVAVGATTFSDAIASFSGGGQVTWSGQTYTKPDMSAPGFGITSCIPGNRYQALSGTSMATPHVAGAAALLLEANPSLTITQLKNILYDAGRELGTTGHDTRFGRGRLDVLSALARATETSLVQGTARGLEGPMAAAIRVKDLSGRLITSARANATSGRYEMALPEGQYLMEASYGQIRGGERTVTVTRGAVSTVDMTLAASDGALENLLVYPNPFKPAQGQEAVTFDGLPQDTTVLVYSMAGEVVKELTGAAAGQLVWNGRNDAGESLAEGIYFYVAKHYGEASGWEHKKGTMAVIR